MKLRVYETFADNGSQTVALELLAQACPNVQVDPVVISEIYKYAIKAYGAPPGHSRAPPAILHLSLF